MGKRAAKWRGDLEEKLGYERLEWRKRIVAMSQFLTETDEMVMDLGAGSMYLKKLLNEGVTYLPVDYKQNSSETIVCDFNRYEFPDVQVDAIVAAGILEYIDDPYWFLSQICSKTKKLIISYKGKEKYRDSLLTTGEVIEFLEKQGFVITGIDETLEEWTLIACFEILNPSNLGNQLNCTGCGACVNACFKDALSFCYDKDGFYKPFCDEKKCINCGQCLEACSLHKNDDVDYVKSIQKWNYPEIYAVWAEDNIRLNSSSGGAFYILAAEILKLGGSVFGAKWNDRFDVEFGRVEDINDLDIFMHSKYVQSDTKKTFREVKEILKSGKPVLYTGLPCQIDGLYSYLDEYAGHELLYTIDLICFGVPSNQVFHKYLNEMHSVSNIRDIVFRDKRAGEGWSPTGYGIYGNDGGVQYLNGEDCFQKAFHNVLFRNAVCEKCLCYKVPRKGDFTLGDFWGIEKRNPTWNDGKGTSLVSINSDKAKRIWDKVQGKLKRVEQVYLDWPQNVGNRFGTNARGSHPNKKYFNELLKRHSIKDSVSRALDGVYDIGIVCMMNYNIGNNLTNYALYSIFSELGFEPQMIDMPRDVLESIPYNEKGPVHYFLKSPYRSGAIFKAKDFWELYEKNNCEIYILGSDQLWRDRFIKTTDYFTTMNWCSPYKKKISYGTSMGKSFDQSDAELVAKTKQGIGRFQCVSVREDFAKSILKEWGINAEIVLDPVFICNRKYFDDLSDRGKLRVPDTKYTFGYFLDRDELKESILKEIADEKSAGEYIASTEPTYVDCDSDLLRYTLELCVEEWVAMIKNSEYIVTDSFHGMCFALIYQKQFWVIFDKKNWRGIERFKDFLSKIGLESRLITQGCILKKDDKINYEEVNQKLQKMKDTSLSWLKKALNSRWMASACDYDYYLKIQNELRNRNIIEVEHNRTTNSELFFHSRLHMQGKKVIRRNFESKMIVGWGAGRCFRDNQVDLEKYCNIEFICDNNSALWNSRLSEKIVCIPPADLLKMENPFVLIMVEDASSVISIVNKLLDMGIYQFEHIDNWRKKLGI